MSQAFAIYNVLYCQQIPAAGSRHRNLRCSSSSSSSSSSRSRGQPLVCRPHHQQRLQPLRVSHSQAAAATRQAGPLEPVPDYAAIDSQPLNQVVMALFRRKMVAAIGSDSQLSGYEAIIDLTRRLNASYSEARQVQLTTRGILNSLFPSWLPGAFKVMFSGPLPEFSCKLNALATALTCQWLMGPCKVNDVELDDGSVGEGMGVLVERCRYLEQAGCASICINSCKVPTQEFFEKDMGLPLTMTPNYEDFSCQFSFGKTPLPQQLDEAFSTPCFQQCPSRAARYADCSRSSSSSSSSIKQTDGGNCPNILKP